MNHQRLHLRNLAGPILLFVVLMLPLADGFTDDGYIHIQYAKNIATRGEYSFNPGETSFGTTSPLWVLELAAIGKVIGVGEELITASRVLSWIAGILTIAAVYFLVLAVGGAPSVAVMAAFAFAANAWMVRWTALSMETSSAVLCVVLMCLAAVRALDRQRDAALLGVLIACAALLRPEVYIAAPAYALTVLTMWRSADKKLVMTTVGVAAVLLLPWLAFAKLHIGTFLPNTAGAKSGGLVTNPVAFVKGFTPVAKILGSTQAITLIALIAGLFWKETRRLLLSRELRFLVIWAIALPVAYVLFGIQILSRYLLLVAPAYCVLGWMVLQTLIAGRSPRVAVLGAMIVINIVLYAIVVVPPSRAFTRDLRTNLKGIGEYLRDNTEPDAVVAAADIGYLSFYSGRRVLDLGGLVEPETGLLRSQYDYIEIVDRGLYFDVPGYPHVDYMIDRVHEPARFDGQTINGYQFTKVHMTTVENLGIKKPGPYYYTVYKLQAVGDG